MSPTRRSVLAAAPVMASAAALTGASGAAANRSAVRATDSDVSDLLARAAQAHTQLMRGDLPGYRALITATDDFTLMAFEFPSRAEQRLPDSTWPDRGNKAA